MKYRGELEALNALIAEQRRTNELIEQLLTQKITVEEPENKSRRGRRKLYDIEQKASASGNCG